MLHVHQSPHVHALCTPITGMDPGSSTMAGRAPGVMGPAAGWVRLADPISQDDSDNGSMLSLQ